MPCLSATGATKDAYCLHLSGGGVQACDQEAGPVGRTLFDGFKDVKLAKAVSSNEGLSLTALKDSDGMHLPRSSEAEEELLPALCASPGLSHFWEAFVSTHPQTESSAEIVVQACSVQEQHDCALLDWGPNKITSVAFISLTLTNRQSNKEVRVFRILTSNTQFCTVDFQEVVVSPGTGVSILLAYIPNHIGKAEGSMLLQTNTGSFKVKNVGEGVLSLIKIHPTLSLVVVSNTEWQDTISFVNPFTEPVAVKEAYVWIGSTLKNIQGAGVLCRMVDTMLECFYRSRLKVRPIAEWNAVPCSSTPILDLSGFVDDGEHLVGTICLRIHWHSVQLLKVLVVPIQIECLGVATSSMLHPKKSLLESKKPEEEESGWGTFVWKTTRWPVQEARKLNTFITMPSESLKLGHAVTNETGGTDWIGYNGKTLLISRLCTKVFLSIKVARHFKFTVSPAFLVTLLTNFGANDTCKDGCLVKHVQCAENFSQYRLNMLLALCRVSGLLADACSPEFVCACKSECGHITWDAIVTIAVNCSNRSITEWLNESPKGTVCLALFSPVDLAVAKNKGYMFNMGLKFDCAWLSLAIESATHSQVARTLIDCDSSESIVSEVFKDSHSELEEGAFRQHSRSKRDTHKVYQRSYLMTLPKAMLGTSKQKESGYANFCGLEDAGLCKAATKSFESSKFNSFDKAVAGGFCEVHGVPVKDRMTDRSLRASVTFSKYQKFVLKALLLILCSVFIGLVKMLRRDKFLMTDIRLRHSYSHTFLLHSVCLRTSYSQGPEGGLSNFKHASKKFDGINIMECENDPHYENRLFNVLAKVARSFVLILQWVFDSQATILNVRVQIAESLCADQGPKYPRSSSLANGNMRLNLVDKPGNHQASSSVQASDCPGYADSSSLEVFEANASTPVCLSSTCCIVEGLPSSTIPVEDSELNFQLKEKKDKRKRRKRRSNIVDLKQEPERMGHSASCSPPSSPASPLTPLAYGSKSPFLWSESPSRPLKGVSNFGRPRSNAFSDSYSRRSSYIQFSNETLSQLDLCGEHAYHYSLRKKGTSQQQLHNFGSKPSLQGTLKPDLPGKGLVRKNSPRDLCTAENWAAVARRAIATTNEPDQRHRLASLSRSSIQGGAQARPVLLPSATFPQRGRTMQWTPRMLERTNLALSEPMMSPSLVSTSLVAPHARAPGSKPSIACNQCPLRISSGRISQTDRAGIDADLGVDQGSRNGEYLYDIWGDHFAEFCRTAQPNILSEDANEARGVALPVSSRAESLFAPSTQGFGYADEAVSPMSRPSSAAFSIFSRDAFY